MIKLLYVLPLLLSCRFLYGQQIFPDFTKEQGYKEILKKLTEILRLPVLVNFHYSTLNGPLEANNYLPISFDKQQKKIEKQFSDYGFNCSFRTFCREKFYQNYYRSLYRRFPYLFSINAGLKF